LSVKESISHATTMPDPRFRFVEMLVPVETLVGPQQRVFALSQTFPWFGKLSMRGRIQEARAATAESKLVAALLQVIYRVKTAYYELAFLGQSLGVTEFHLNLLTQWEQVARARYESGLGSYADVVKAQFELAVLADRIEELRDRFRPKIALLNAILNRPSRSPVPGPIPVESLNPKLDEATLQARLLAENPELLAWQHEAARFRYAGDYTKKLRFPDLTIGLQYIQTGTARNPGIPDSGKDPVMFSLSINIPLWQGKYSAAQREEAGHYRSATATRQDLENTLTAALENALYGYRDASRKLGLYRNTMLPKGRQALSATTAAWEAGQSSFLEVVDAERALLEFELSVEKADVDRLIKLAEIEMLVGGPVVAVDSDVSEMLENP